MTTQSSSGSNGRVLTFAVDRRENDVWVLVDDAGETTEVAASQLPAACRTEGAVLRVPLGESSEPNWAAAKRDSGEEQRRLAAYSERLGKLRKRDPGGDVSL